MKKAVLSVLLLIATLSISAQTIHYVKTGGTGNGTSWASASGDIQGMINGAAWGDQIWVSAGTYSRASGLSYSLKNGIKLYGGFPATGNPVIENRNPATNITILQGNGNRVMLNADVDFTALIDGFIIQGGTITGGDGGGILNSNSSPVFSNCIIRNNTTANWGGGLFSIGQDAHPKFVNCLVYGNTAGGGGGAFEHNYATPIYINCTFSGNTSTVNGGAIHTYTNASATLQNCIVWNNEAAGAGDELYSIGSSSITASYSLVSNDTNDITGTFTGNNNLTTDPLFESGNYMLLSCSPAINAGNNSYIPAGTITDLAANTRQYNSGTVDIGAYEYQAAPSVPAAPTAVTQVFCNGATVANLSVTGAALKWYTTSTGGTALSTTAILATGNYYVSQTINSCESPRTSVNIIINSIPAAPTSSAQNFCVATTIGGLTASGTDIKWYLDLTGGMALATDLNVTTGIYHVSQTVNGCESIRTPVSISVNSVPVAPLASSQAFCGSAMITDLTAEGDGLQWYADATEGTALEDTVSLATATYYVSQTVNGCESARTPVSVYVYAIPNAPEASAQAFCGSAIVSDLSAEGVDLQWYADSTGGTFLEASAFLATEIYYVSQTIDGCESARTPVNVLVNPIPDAPEASAQAFCGSAVVTDLAAEGDDLRWYADATEDITFEDTASLATATYYVSQTVDGCESARTPVSISVYSIPSAPEASAQVFCGNAIVSELVAEGVDLQWYADASETIALDGTTPLIAATYYVSQTVDGCESGRTAVNVSLYPVPAAPVGIPQTFCGSTLVSDLTADGVDLQWYAETTGGTALSSTAPLTTNTYYVSQTIDGCESQRTAINITVKPVPLAPVATTPQSVPYGTTLATLAASGTNLQWYNTATSDTAMDPATITVSQTYYVSQQINGCESPRTAIVVSVYYPVRYVKATASGLGDGTSWSNASSNLQAMIDAAHVQEVWVAAGIYKPTTIAGDGNTDRHKAFLMKTNVKVYGGFAGNETALDGRDWVTNITVLSGDIGAEDDTSDNAYKVVIFSGSSSTPTLDGFTITAGNANAQNTGWTVNNHFLGTNSGGGIYIAYSSPTLANLTISNNLASYGGGGMFNQYSSPRLTNVIISGNASGIYNNSTSSPTLTNVTITGNQGDGMYSYYNCSPKLTNVTISGNGNYGIFNNASVATLKNTIVYGNHYDVNTGTSIFNSLVEGNDNTSNGNIVGHTNPLFVNAPSYTTAPFTGGDYTLQPCSLVINSGNNTYISDNVSDLAGNPRIYSSGIVDMGAYEYQADGMVASAAPIAPASQTFDPSATVASLAATGSNLQWYNAKSGNTPLTADTLLLSGSYYVSQTGDNGCESLRTVVTVDIIYPPVVYVKPEPSGTGDGTSWINAAGSIQTMINGTGVQQVWVAAGTYKPDTNVGNSIYDKDKAFVLKNNVKVYGGFNGTETELTQRNLNTNTSILSGDLGIESNTSDNAEHVVISSGEVGGAELNGFTIKNGGNSSTSNSNIPLNNNVINPFYGGGVYLVSSSPALVNLVITNNLAKNYGGGIYTQNSASEITDVTITNNVSVIDGGGVYNYESFTSFTDVVLSGNSCQEGMGGAVHNYGGSVKFTDVTISNNTAFYAAGMANQQCSLELTNVVVSGNIAESEGGGFYNASTFTKLMNVTIKGNKAPYGAGIYNWYSNDELTNVSITGNSADYGGGMYNYSTTSVLTNVTIAGNRGYGIYVEDNEPMTFRNSIISGNDYGTNDGNFTYLTSLSQEVNTTANGNLTSDPLFVEAVSFSDAPSTGGDYRVQSCSPAINAGSNSYIIIETGDNTTYVDTDVAGDPRRYSSGTVDIGAYEYQGDIGTASEVPVAASPQNIPPGSTVADLVATGSNLKWYGAATGGGILLPETVVFSGTYYVTQASTGCDSPRVPVVVVSGSTAILYVKPEAAGVGNGGSWADASGDLQAMIDTPGVQEVWVAAGEYQSDFVNTAFVMQEGVKIYGGFPVSGTPAMAQRNIRLNATILKGNGERVINNDNNGLTAAALLDGFIIQNGDTSGNGGGMNNINSYPSIRNCIFRNNKSGIWGGAILNEGDGSTTITNCLFYSNLSTGGGAAFDYQNAQTVYTNVTFANNISSGNGGAIHTYEHAVPSLYNCIFYGNNAMAAGDQIISSGNGSIEVTNCLMESGTSGIDGPFVNNGILTGNPLFMDAISGDYRLLAGSPAVNAGNNDFFTNAATATDLSGNTRIYNGIIDLGAYENQPDCTVYWDDLNLNQQVCVGATVSELTAVGSNIKWYAAATGGNPLLATKTLLTRTYYVTQTVCIESERIAVEVVVNCTAILPRLCGSTLDKVTTFVRATLVPSATGYRFRITDGITTEIIETAESKFKLTDTAIGSYNTTYTIDVAARVNGSWGSYGPTCTISTGEAPTTNITDSFCSAEISLNTLIKAVVVPYATVYRFRVLRNGVEEIVDRPTQILKLSMLQSYAYDATYIIDVATMVDGIFTDYGTACSVYVPAASTGLKESVCNMTVTPNTTLSAHTVLSASQYRFRITNGAIVTTIDRPANSFKLSMIPGFTYNTLYSIDVAVMIGGSFSSYGPACSVYLPPASTNIETVFCDTQVSPNAFLYAIVVPSAQMYRFRITDGITTAILDRPSRSMKLMMIPSFGYGTSYVIDVAVKIGGTFTEYGPACVVTTLPQNARFAQETDNAAEDVSLARNVFAYPNPYSDIFMLKLEKGSADQVHVQVYEVTGKQVDDISITPEELESLRIGKRYSAGMYTVIVTQADYQKTLKIIKQ